MPKESTAAAAAEMARRAESSTPMPGEEVVVRQADGRYQAARVKSVTIVVYHLNTEGEETVHCHSDVVTDPRVIVARVTNASEAVRTADIMNKEA